MLGNQLRTNFLQNLIQQREAVTIFLINGVKLQGAVENFDDYGLLLEHRGHRQFVYGHAISTIMPVIVKQTQSNNQD